MSLYSTEFKDIFLKEDSAMKKRFTEGQVAFAFIVTTSRNHKNAHLKPYQNISVLHPIICMASSIHGY